MTNQLTTINTVEPIGGRQQGVGFANAGYADANAWLESKDLIKLRKAAKNKQPLLELLDSPAAHELSPSEWIMEFMAAAGTAKAKKALVTLTKVAKPELIIQGLRDFPTLWKVFTWLDAPEALDNLGLDNPELRQAIDKDPDKHFWKSLYVVKKFPVKMANYLWQQHQLKKQEIVIPSAWLTKPILTCWTQFALNNVMMDKQETFEVIQTVSNLLPGNEKNKQILVEAYQETWQMAIRHNKEGLIKKLQAMKIPYEASYGLQRADNPLSDALVAGSTQGKFDLVQIKDLAHKKYLWENLHASWAAKWFTEVKLNVATLEVMAELGLDPMEKNQVGMRWIEWAIMDAVGMEEEHSDEECNKEDEICANALRYLSQQWRDQLMANGEVEHSIESALVANPYLVQSRKVWQEAVLAFLQP